MTTATIQDVRLVAYVFANAAGRCYPDKAHDDRPASHPSAARQFHSEASARAWCDARPETRKALEAGGYLLCKVDGWLNPVGDPPR